jgi:hypothetical protein
MTNYSQTYPKLTGLHNYCIREKSTEIGGEIARGLALLPMERCRMNYLFLTA